MIFRCLTLRLSHAGTAPSPAEGIVAEAQNLFQHRAFHFTIIALIALIVLFAKLDQGDLAGFDDAVYAHEGKTMLMTGDWWNVWLNGKPDFDKPPLFIWLEALSMMIFGITDFAAKFPAALLGLATIALMFLLARELSDDFWMPVLAMLVIACTPFFMRMSMHAMTDVPFAFLFTLSIYFYVRALKRPAHLLSCGMAIAAGIMIRSVLGLIPLAIVVLHLAFVKRWELLRSKYLLGCILLAVGLPMIWFASQYRVHGEEFLALHFSYSAENLPRTEGKSVSQFAAGLFRYPELLLKYYWRWLPLVLIGAWLCAKRLWKTRDQSAALLFIWIFCVMAPFSLLEIKYLRYILPAFPAFTLLAATALNRLIPEARKIIGFKIAYAVLVAIMVVLAVVPKYRVRPEEMRSLAPVAQSLIPPERPILLYTYGKQSLPHLYQVIWYADRNADLRTDINEVLAEIETSAEAAVIMDKETYSQIAETIGDHIRVEAESENFVCVGKKITE